MKLFNQIIFGAEKGDCLRTCIAIMIDAEKLEDVPNFVHVMKNENDKDWWLNVQKWCVLKGYMIDSYSYPQAWKPQGDGVLWIGCGPAERRLQHAVIMKGNELFHDPHPSKAGLISINMAIVVSNVKDLLDYYHEGQCSGCYYKSDINY